MESYDTYVGGYGENKVCIIKDQAEGSLISRYLSSTMLFNAFKKLRPKIGKRLGFRYLGKNSDGENDYHRYKVIIDCEMDLNAFFGVVPSPVQAPLEIEGMNDVPL